MIEFPERSAMLLKRCFPVVVLLFTTAVASAQVKFEAKYVESSKWETHRDSKTTQTLTLAGMNIDTKSSAFAVIEHAVGQRAADGALKVEEKTKTLQTEISFPGGKIEFDSANLDKKADNPLLEPLLEVFRAVVRLPITMELDTKNQLTAIKLPDGEFEKLPEAAKERFNPDVMKKAMERANDFLPSEPVKKGETWERFSEMNLGSGQTMSFRTRYEYEGTSEKEGTTFEKISGTALDVTFAINGNPMLQVTKSELKILNSKSTYLFDQTLGAVSSSTSKMQIAGPLTLVINGMELPGKVDLTIEESTKRQK